MGGDRTLGRARGRCVLVTALNAPPTLHTGSSGCDRFHCSMEGRLHLLFENVFKHTQLTHHLTPQ